MLFPQTENPECCVPGSLPCAGTRNTVCYRREVKFFTCRSTGSDLKAHTVRMAEFPDINAKAAVCRIKAPQLEVPLCVYVCVWVRVCTRVLGMCCAFLYVCLCVCMCVCPEEPSIQEEWFCRVPNSSKHRPHFQIKQS